MDNLELSNQVASEGEYEVVDDLSLSLSHNLKSDSTESYAFPSDVMFFNEKQKPKKDYKKMTKEGLRTCVYKVKEHKDLLFTIPIAAIVLLVTGLVIWPKEDLTLSWEGWLAIVFITLLMLFLVSEVANSALLFMITLCLLMVCQIITVDTALAGFSNSNVIAIALLYCVGCAIEESTALVYVIKYLLGTPKRLITAQIRLLIPVAIASGFLSNTTMVSIMCPVVDNWSRSSGLIKSHLILPLGTATILGGGLTVIGAQNIMLCISLLSEQPGAPKIDFFDPLPVAAPCLIIGLLFIFATSSLLLPTRQNTEEKYEASTKTYLTAIRLQPTCSFVQSPLSDLRIYLKTSIILEIIRCDAHITIPDDSQILEEGDIIYLTASDVSVVQKLNSTNGMELLEPDMNQRSKQRKLIVGVVSIYSDLLEKTPKAVKFKDTYGAVILAVHRGGELVKDMRRYRFKVGDSVLMETNFGVLTQSNGEFINVHEVGVNMEEHLPQTKPLHALFAFLNLVMIVVVTMFDWLELVEVVLISTILFILFGTITVNQAIKAISVRTMIVTAIALALSSALVDTGAANNIAYTMLSFFSLAGEFGILAGVFVTTSVLATLISPSASVSLMFPIAYSVPTNSNVTLKEVIVTLMMASNTSFMTPWSRSSNLIVAEAGGYKTLDFVKYGLFFTVMMCVVTVLLVYFLPLYEDDEGDYYDGYMYDSTNSSTSMFVF